MASRHIAAIAFEDAAHDPAAEEALHQRLVDECDTGAIQEEVRRAGLEYEQYLESLKTKKDRPPYVNKEKPDVMLTPWVIDNLSITKRRSPKNETLLTRMIAVQDWDNKGFYQIKTQSIHGQYNGPEESFVHSLYSRDDDYGIEESKEHPAPVSKLEALNILNGFFHQYEQIPQDALLLPRHCNEAITGPGYFWITDYRETAQALGLRNLGREGFAPVVTPTPAALRRTIATELYPLLEGGDEDTDLYKNSAIAVTAHPHPDGLYRLRLHVYDPERIAEDAHKQVKRPTSFPMLNTPLTLAEVNAVMLELDTQLTERWRGQEDALANERLKLFELYADHLQQNSKKTYDEDYGLPSGPLLPAIIPKTDRHQGLEISEVYSPEQSGLNTDQPNTVWHLYTLFEIFDRLLEENTDSPLWWDDALTDLLDRAYDISCDSKPVELAANQPNEQYVP